MPEECCVVLVTVGDPAEAEKIASAVVEERLDRLPSNKQIGFFSDAYCVEWVYGKLGLVRRCLADVLAGRVEAGQFSMDEALGVAQRILYDAPQRLLGFRPCETL